MTRRLYPAVYIAAITAAGALATWLPCPCHRKDRRS